MENKEQSIGVGICLWLALMCLLVPFSWLTAMMLAALVHEAGHLVAIGILSGSWQHIRLSNGGVRISLPEINGTKEMICALSGPMAGLFLLVLWELFPKMAICGLFQSFYNLLPIYPLDGGRALQCLLTILFSPPKAKKVMACVTWICKILLLIFGFLFCCYTKHGFMILLICILTVLRIK
jgi:stage IV sporulation protein FB